MRWPRRGCRADTGFGRNRVPQGDAALPRAAAGTAGGATIGPLPDGAPTGTLGPSMRPLAGSPGRLGGSPGRISGEESEAWADSASSCSRVCVAA